ncbi:hypothetical protein ACFQHQ_08240 [Zunongwangia atlantica 22II14-10F7]
MGRNEKNILEKLKQALLTPLLHNYIMKIKYLFMLGFLSVFQIMQGQEEDEDKRNYDFHLLVGSSITDTYFSFTNDTESNTEPGVGISVGIGTALNLSKRLYLTLDYILRLRRSKDIYFDNNFNLYYLSFPGALNIRVNKILDIAFGPQVEIILFTNGDDRKDGEMFSHSLEHRNLGVHVGPIIHLSEKSSIALKYFTGLNNIGINYEGLYREFRIKSFGLRYSYIF